MAPALQLLHHRGGQRGVQEEEEGEQGLESGLQEIGVRHLTQLSLNSRISNLNLSIISTILRSRELDVRSC